MLDVVALVLGVPLLLMTLLLALGRFEASVAPEPHGTDEPLMGRTLGPLDHAGVEDDAADVPADPSSNTSPRAA